MAQDGGKDKSDPDQPKLHDRNAHAGLPAPRTKQASTRLHGERGMMTMRIATASLAGLLLAGPVLADQPGADWMPASQVKQKLTDGGYSSITAFEADDGHWEGEGVKNGHKMQFHADPRTGAILSEKPDD